MKVFRLFIKLILIILVILFVVYVWPTPYRNISGGYPYSSLKLPFRINRITGTGEVWHPSGWKKMN
jgi:hypothetical protein